MREIAARFIKRNGAYLIEHVGSLNHSWTNDNGANYDCAGSLRVAKRVARDGAAEIGYVGPFRWQTEGTSTWVLEATVEDG